jgi:hypothetical protein
MTPETTNHAASTGDTSADTNHAQGKEQSEKNTVGDWMDGWANGPGSVGWDGLVGKRVGE